MVKLVVGVNDLATIRPDLAKEWNYERNGDLTPEMITCGSGKKVWWICEKGHEWEASTNSRTNRNSGCPICSGHQALAGFNDLATLRPDLSAEWHPTKNGKLTPEMVTCGSVKKVWWKCEKGHEWKASIGNRTNRNSGCPICSGHQALAGFNDLVTLLPDLAAEWHPTKNGNLTPEMVTLGSNKKVWWKCFKHPEHEWKASIHNRADRNSGCPICSGKQVLKGFNDIATLRPDLSAEWHPTKNGKLTPEMVTCGSKKKVWWKCSKHPEHEWESTIKGRTRGNGCPICAKERMVSFPEKIIAYYLKKVLPIKENIFVDRWNVDILYDNIVIEYDGEYFHSQCVDKDDFKNKDLNELGFTVIRILGKNKSDYIKKSEFKYEIRESNYDHFKQLISDLCTYLKVSCPDVDVERDKEKIKELLD